MIMRLVKKIFLVLCLSSVSSFSNGVANNQNVRGFKNGKYDISTGGGTGTDSGGHYVEGFAYLGGFDNSLEKENDTGYMYYSLSAYYCPFSSCSDLLLIEAKCEYVSGYIACSNNETGFNKLYDLYKGYFHVDIEPYNRTDDYYVLKQAYPKSSSFTSIIQSSYGISLSDSCGLDVGMDMVNGVSVISKTSTTIGFHYDKSTSISGPDPAISYQLNSSDNTENEWSYSYADLGRITLNFETSSIYEIRANSTGTSPYRFYCSVSGLMTNIAFKGHFRQNTVNTSFQKTAFL